MILPILEYGDIYHMSAKLELRKKIQILQNRALKCALGRDKRYNTKMLHKEAKIEKLKTRRQQHLTNHMFQISKQVGFKGWKPRKTNIVTRLNKKKLMKVKKPNTTKYRNSIAFLGPKTWNNLPLDLQKIESYTEFKNKVIQYQKEKNKKKERENRT